MADLKNLQRLAAAADKARTDARQLTERALKAKRQADDAEQAYRTALREQLGGTPA